MNEGKRAVVTGASSGIGMELTKQLSRRGYFVTAASRHIQEAEFDGDRIIPYTCDLSQANQIDELIQFAEKEMGGIDFYFANAGFAYYERLTEKQADWNHIDELFKLDVFSVIYGFEKMLETKGEEAFTYVITASAMSFMALPGYSLYSSAKFALQGFMESIRYELEKDQKLIGVFPIATRTRFFSNAGSRTEPWPVQDAEIVARRIIRGVENAKENIYPSKLFSLFLRLQTFLPVIRKLYMSREKKKLMNRKD
ncbi:MAG: SDR family NAD(P)-dependent oxidoreductase [Spirochaetia bacterium]|nr:SDR family NAD(P)-dependent oxidoreductase [Spirochaetia bacterium]